MKYKNCCSIIEIIGKCAIITGTLLFSSCSKKDMPLLKGKILYALGTNKIYQFDFETRKEEIFYEDKDIVSGIMDVELFDVNNVLFTVQDRISHIRKLDMTNKTTEFLFNGQSPFSFPEINKLLYYIYDYKSDKVDLLMTSYDSLAVSRQIMHVGNYRALNSVVKLSNEELVFCSNNYVLCLFNVISGKLNELNIFGNKPLFYDKGKNILYCYNKEKNSIIKVDWFTKNIYPTSIGNNPIYIEKYRAIVSYMPKLNLKAGETGDLHIYFLENDKDYVIGENIKYYKGIYIE
jgi:hypothetical protein